MDFCSVDILQIELQADQDNETINIGILKNKSNTEHYCL